MVHDIIIKWLA